jgi:hypothetical protein
MSTHSHLPPLTVTVRFEPTRMAPACLQDAYHLLLPRPRRLNDARPPAPRPLAPPPLTSTQQKGVAHEHVAHRPLRPSVV